MKGWFVTGTDTEIGKTFVARDLVRHLVARGDRVELRGFGAFSVKKRDSRTGRNPRTGEAVEVEEKHVPFFKTGKLLRDRLNGK